MPAWIAGWKLVREPCSDSSESAQARSAVRARRLARTSASDAIAAMNCVPLISESPSFAASRIGSSPAAASASSPDEERAVEPRLSLADERQRQMRERCEIATRPDRAARGHTREHAAVEALDQELDRLDSGARVALGERVRAEQHRRADDLVRVRLADPAGMAAQQAKLQLLDLVVRDRLRDEAAEPGVDAVRVLAHPLDERARRLHPRPRLVRERHRHTVDGDLPDVLDPEVVPRQSRARDHVTSLAQDEHPRERMLMSEAGRGSPTRGPGPERRAAAEARESAKRLHVRLLEDVSMRSRSARRRCPIPSRGREGFG